MELVFDTNSPLITSILRYCLPNIYPTSALYAIVRGKCIQQMCNIMGRVLAKAGLRRYSNKPLPLPNMTVGLLTYVALN